MSNIPNHISNMDNITLEMGYFRLELEKGSK